MRRRIPRALGGLALALLLPTIGLAAGGDDDRAAELLRREDGRIRAMAALAGADALPEPPPPPAALPGGAGATCGLPHTRLVPVSGADELRAALADARPGDLIRMADGVYAGRFVADRAGSADGPITLCGSRGAVIDAGSLTTGYGLHLRADHWNIVGFTIRNALKGLMADGAHATLIRGLEVHSIGDEGIHLRAGSADNQIERSWVHDTGLHAPQYGEGIYIGSAHSNWATVSGGAPDASDRNRVVGNLIGPNVTAEAVDIKEGSSAGVVADNLFLTAGSLADAAVDVKGNGYEVARNGALSPAGGPLVRAAKAQEVLAGWGRGNALADNREEADGRGRNGPFRATDRPDGPATIVLPARPLPYTLAEVIARFPASFEDVAPGATVLKEHLLLAKGARMTIGGEQAGELRLLSGAAGFVSLVSFRGELGLIGSAARPLRIVSWDPAAGGADTAMGDGRAYVLARGGRMDIAHSTFADLGFGLGQTSGVAWKGFGEERSRGDVRASRFERNQFGAYTYEAEGMRWQGNLFINNHGYGFDPHDFSNNFVVEHNAAVGNGSHGIIFSRGCSGSVIRHNISADNRGAGIFIDDGKVLVNNEPRYAKPVPSNDNLIEHNLVRGNEVGIIFEGGSGNTVRMNVVEANQVGIRLNDNVSGNEFRANLIAGSARLAFHLFSGSAGNQIVDNQIAGGSGGLLIVDSPANVIAGNTITGILGRGVAVSGEAGGTRVADNQIAGVGSRAIDVLQAAGVDPAQVAGNDLSAWVEGRPLSPPEAALVLLKRHPAIVLWAAIFLVPLAMWLPGRRRRAYRAAR